MVSWQDEEDYESLDLVTTLVMASRYRRLTWERLHAPASNGTIALYHGRSFSTDVTILVAGELAAVAAVTISQAGAALFTSNPGLIRDSGDLPWIDAKHRNMRWFPDGTLLPGLPELVATIQLGTDYSDLMGNEASAFRLRIALLVKHALERKE